VHIPPHSGAFGGLDDRARAIYVHVLEGNSLAGLLGDNADQVNRRGAAGHCPIECGWVEQAAGEGLHARVGRCHGVVIDQGMNIESALEQPGQN
jgi:hypothetical protein